MTLNNRHPSTQHMITMLKPNPNLKGKQALIADDIWTLACNLISNEPDNYYNLVDSPELTAGLRKLLEAKDCFVRASLDLDPVVYTDR